MKQLKWWFVILVSLACIASAAYMGIEWDWPKRYTPEPKPKETYEEVETFLEAMGIQAGTVESVEICATNETGDALKGSAVSFFVRVEGTDSTGARYSEIITDGLSAQPAAGAILLGSRWAVIARNASSPVTITVKYKELSKSFTYRPYDQPLDVPKEDTLVTRLTAGLPRDYGPEGIVNVGGKPVSNIIASDLKEMIAAAAADGVTLTVQSGYRDYDYQQVLYEKDVERYGLSQNYTAMAGYSEHQTGLAVDLNTPSMNGQLAQGFDQTPAFKWLRANAYKYGFILRYEDTTEVITNYAYEPWHYRYIGRRLAKAYHDEGYTTLEEFLSQKR